MAFEENTVMSALCLYEDILERVIASDTDEADEIDRYWGKLQESIGAYALRQVAIDLAPKIDAAWETVYPDLFDDAFDWEFVPLLLEKAVVSNSEAFLSWDEDKWKSFAVDVCKTIKATEQEASKSEETKKRYRVELENGDVVKDNLTLDQAEETLLNYCNDGEDAFIVEED